MATTARPRRYTGEVLIVWKALVGLAAERFVHKLAAISRTTDQGAAVFGPVEEAVITLKFATGATPADGAKLTIKPANQIDANGIATYDTDAAIPTITTPFDGAGTTLSSQASTGSAVVNVTSATGFAVDDNVLIKDGSVYKEYRLVAINGTAFTLDRNADAAHASGSLIKKMHVYSAALTTRGLAALLVQVNNLDGDNTDSAYISVVASGECGDEIG